jgi:sulfate adenylyltransferase
LSEERRILSDLVPPYGGRLLPRLVTGAEAEEIRTAAKSMPQINMNSKEVSDLIMLSMGAFSPLDGFMTSNDYRKVVSEMRLSNGLLWPIPVTLSISRESASSIKEGREVRLLDSVTNEVMGIMLVAEKYYYDTPVEAIGIFGTPNREHPGVKQLYEQGDVYIGGPVRIISEGDYPKRFIEFARPEEIRAIFSEKGWKTVAAFQTRNPIHRSHEYLTKIALEVCDGLLIHPIVGKLKAGDIPAEIRMRCYNTMIDKYYPKDRVLLKVYPMEMRYAGPREAVLHAIIRQNFGCSHIIIGRDHAGVGSYYGPFDAQAIFDTLDTSDLQIQPLKLDATFWCYKCDSMASYKTCPHSESDHLLISGTKLREMLENGERPPVHFSRQEVTDILLDYYRRKSGDN